MKKRVISLLLALVLCLPLLLLPVLAEAEPQPETSKGQQLMEQIKTIYSTARRRSGRYSFNGWCGSLVNWQTHLLGIDTRVHGCDGKDEYDLYARQSITCGGYGVKAYPASQYTLLDALNTITRNGTLDVYNILVGFQRTNTQAGQIYGHALMIHGIVDGVVYFMDCFTVSINGKYYAEGSPITCTIEEFCRFYNRWTVFDGVIYFGVKTYAQACTEYPANMTALALQDTQALTEPEDPGVHEASGVAQALEKGQIVTVTGVYRTPEGNDWYQLALDGVNGYVPVDKLAPLKQDLEDAVLSGVSIPSTARRGVGVVLRGSLGTLSNKLKKVEVLVSSAESGEMLLHAAMDVSGKSASLSDGKLDRDLKFRDLPAGTYRIKIRATTATSTMENGVPTEKSAAQNVWQSELRIITGWNTYYTVSFDGNGGKTPLNQTVYAKGETLSVFPEATRPGYRFLGWSLTADGSEPVTPDTLPQKNVTLYACWEQTYAITEDPLSVAGDWSWTPVKDGSGWFCTAFGIRFFRAADGAPVSGWVDADGQRYWLNSAGALSAGWLTLGEDTYYLDTNGTQIHGWRTLDGSARYFDEDGKLHKGWLTLDSQRYYLTDEGIPVVGWQEIDGESCCFGADGVLQLSQKDSGGGGYFVVYDPEAADSQISADASLLLG